jgi:hypothetical protein
MNLANLSVFTTPAVRGNRLLLAAILGELKAPERHALDIALKHGAQLQMTFTPETLDRERIELVVVEKEGNRRILVTVGIG